MSVWQTIVGFFCGDNEVDEEKLIYRTLDNTQDYGFHFVRQPNNTYRIYITSQPSYYRRRTDGHSTHRYYDSVRGQHYICIQAGSEPTSMEHARNWAKEWAESTERYRKHGTEF